MKCTFLKASALASLLLLGACSDNRSRSETSEQSSDKPAEGATDSSGFTSNTNGSALADSAGPAAGDANNATGNYTADSKTDKSAMSTTADAGEFLRDATVGNLAEIRSSELAKKKSTQKGLQDFASKMIEDHQANLSEVKKLAPTKSVILPTDLTPDKKQEIEKMQNLTGKAFDQAYADFQLKAHQETVAKFESAAQSIGDPEVKQFANKSLPKLQMHLKMISEMQSKAQ